MSCSVKNWK